MNKLQQRMADAGYERSNDLLIRVQAERTRASWVRYQADKWNGGACELVTLTEQERQERDEYIKANQLPF